MKTHTQKFILSGMLTISLALGAPAYAADSDLDGTDDAIDNCLGKANTDQRDTDGDGFGNLCDGDLNNDGKVNSLDLGLFKKQLNTAGPGADFNGDGIVNSTDTAILQQLMLKAPGPTALVLDPALKAHFPQASSVDFVTISPPPRPDGKNAVFYINYKSGQPVLNKPAVVLDLGKQRIVVNDFAAPPDQVAGDGKYSGYATLNVADLVNAQHELATQIATLTNPTVVEYDSRDVIGTTPYSATPPLLPAMQQSSGKTVPVSPIFASSVPFSGITGLPVAYDSLKVLMITDPGVVADPTRTYDPCDTDGMGNSSLLGVNNVWSFKALMANMANGQVPLQQFIHNWLKQWTQTLTINGFTVTSRNNIRAFFTGWDPNDATTLDIDHLPFRLLAIVNRMDLGVMDPYGGLSSPGETRFVFGLENPAPSCLGPAQGTVIFEYGDVDTSASPPLGNCGQKRAKDWLGLNPLTPGTPPYNSALQQLTDKVTIANAATAFGFTKPNGSALNQLRTNESAFDTSGLFELREFRLNATSKGLEQTTLTKTPDKPTYNATPQLDSVLVAFANQILCETFQPSQSFPTTLAGSVTYSGGAFWNFSPTSGTGLALPNSFPFCHANSGILMTGWNNPPTYSEMKSQVRHKFSLGTCDDCHAKESGTFFHHVNPLSLAPVDLSGFLTGNTFGQPTLPNVIPTFFSVNDAAAAKHQGTIGNVTISRDFNDLVRRGQMLEEIATFGCTAGTQFPMDVFNSH